MHISETPTPFNLNQYVRVRLTETGRDIITEQAEELNRMFPGVRLPTKPYKEDEEGWSRWQLWDLMRTLGPHISMGSLPPLELTIEFIT